MRRKQFTDGELYATACRCFIEGGPTVSISDIATHLGVSAAALFKRVGTKEELLCRSLAHGLKPSWLETATRGPDDRPVETQLLDLARVIDAFLQGLLPRISVLKAAGIHPGQLFRDLPEPPPVTGVRALASWFAKLDERELASVPNATATAVAFLGALQARHFMRHMLGVAYPDGGSDYLEVLVNTFWAGIAPKKATTT